MPHNTIIENTLYPSIIEYLKKSGFQSIGESHIGTGRNSPDVVFSLNDQKFIMEIKISNGSANITNAMGQALRYVRELQINNVIILIYPSSYKNRRIIDNDWLDDMALHKKTRLYMNTKYWTEDIEETPANMIAELKKKIQKGEQKIDLKAVVKQIQATMNDFQNITRYVKKDEMVNEVVEQLDLFTSIGDLKDKEAAKNQIVSLSTYLLFNQLMFYKVYREKIGNSRLKPMKPVKKVSDIYRYFEDIVKIDFKSIYRVNILRHIPDNPKVIGILNDVIEAIGLIRADLVTHDLAGRLFHELIPFEIRKILAAFYTHPNSADLLAELTIDSPDEKIIDPACGSGTLLVASYLTKMKMWSKDHGYVKRKKFHKIAIEEEITGLDIMPFAAHISAINLAMQEVEQSTNVVRIAAMDSLSLAGKFKTGKFIRGKGLEISGYERTTQMTLDDTKAAPSRIEGSVSMQGRGSAFHLQPVDVVMMNPPFTAKEKMPKMMLDKINDNNILNDMVGGMVDLWGFFIGLSHLMLKNNARVGCVIPINIARGGGYSNCT